ncbi:MAG: hypothetical protein GDA56_09950 [Hormoscilla sp. GM7CHS1pb]|nr:hypothetical protein [Hormoscilla sp. GM7CHS1pb]
MILNIVGDKLQIEWEWYEQLWGANLEKTWEIPLSHIQAVTTEEPASSWTEIRAPGTFFPGIIKAGTYYSNRGKEFWYVTNDRDYLVLSLQEESFQKIILTLEQNEDWRSRIAETISELISANED